MWVDTVQFCTLIIETSTEDALLIFKAEVYKWKIISVLSDEGSGIVGNIGQLDTACPS
jgi:hypothetical protein